MEYDICVLCPKFYKYEERIKEEIESKGLNGSYIFYDENELLVPSFIGKLVLLVVRFFLSCLFLDYTINKRYNLLRNYFILKNSNESFINYLNSKIGNNKFKKLLVIKGFGMNACFLDGINAHEKIIYQWDSVLKYPSVIPTYRCYDRIYCFDKRDSNNGFGTFLPNFYVKNDKVIEPPESKDLVFVGAFSFQRYFILKDLIKHAKHINVSYYFHLYLGSKFNGLKFFLDSEITKTVKLERELYQGLVNKSLCLVEISNNGQYGATQRVLEGISKGKLIIINKNSDIYDDMFVLSLSGFYNSNKIDLISKSKRIKDKANIYTHLEIGNWLEYILTNKG